MSELEIKIIAYVILALGIVAGASYATHKLDAAHYEALEAQYAKYQAQVQSDAASAQQAARAALQAQIDEKAAQEAANARIMSDLESRADAAERNASFAQRLLSAARASGAAPAGHQMSGADNQPGTVGAPGASGDRPAFDLPGTLAASAGECRDAIERLEAIQAELQPQLKVYP